MKHLGRIALVLAGYFFAFLFAAAVTYLRIERTSGPAFQSSSGMNAFGDAAVFAGIFAFLSIGPTALALFFLRPWERAWDFISYFAVTLAATAPLAEIFNTVIRIGSLWNGPWVLPGFLSLMRVFGAPLMALGFGVCSLVAPTPKARKALLVASSMELGVALYVLIFFILHQRFA